MPDPADMAAPPVDGSLPLGIQSRGLTGRVSGTGAYQEAPPVSSQEVPSAEAMMQPAMAGYQGQASANQELYTARNAEAELQAQQAAEREQIGREMDTERAIANAKREQAVLQGNEAIERARQQVKSVNPSRRFQNMSTFQQAAGMIGAAIGGYYAPYNGGKNATIDLLVKLADQDIDAQKADQDAALAGVSSAERGAERAVNNAQEAIRNVHFERASRLEAVADHFAGEAAKVKSQFNAAELLKANADIMARAAEEYQKAKNYETEQVFARQVHADNKAQQVADRRQRAAQFSKSFGLQERQFAADEERKNAPPDAAPPDVVFSAMNGDAYEIDPRRGGEKLGASQRADIDKGWQDRATIAKDVKSLYDVSTEQGSMYRGALALNKVTSDQDKLAVEGLRSWVKAKIQYRFYGGTTTAEQEKEVDKMVGSLESWTKNGPQKQLRGVMDRFGNEQQNAANSLNLSRVDQRTGQRKAYDSKEEFFIPEAPKPELPKSAPARSDVVRSLAQPNPARGPDTIKAGLQAAEDSVKKIETMNPRQVGIAYAAAMEAAVALKDSDPAASRALVKKAERMEKFLQDRKKELDSGGAEQAEHLRRVLGEETPEGYYHDQTNVNTALKELRGK